MTPFLSIRPWPTTPRRAFAVFALVAFAALASPANAHQPGTSSLLLRASVDGSLAGEVHIADVDLEALRLMLINRAGRTTPAITTSLDASTLPWLRLSVDGEPLAIDIQPPRPAETDGLIHTMIPFTASVSDRETLVVEYADYFEFDPQHKVVTSLEAGGSTRVGLISYDRPVWETTIVEPGPASQFLKFTWEGVWHIWIGIDHILFLLALLLPSVLVLREGRWQPVPDFNGALINVFKVVTAFTVAHSVTLSLAALHIVTLPGKFVESVIAISVLLAALNNIWPVVSDRVWLVAFGFGFIHGFGFANVLADLQLPTGTLAVALVSFNVGVEIGQLVIVAVFFPLAFALRKTAFYQPVKLRLGSALISVIAVGWIVQRVFEVDVLPF